MHDLYGSVEGKNMYGGVSIILCKRQKISTSDDGGRFGQRNGWLAAGGFDPVLYLCRRSGHATKWLEISTRMKKGPHNDDLPPVK